MRKILGTLTAVLAAGALVGFALSGPDQRTISANVAAPGATAQLQVEGDQARLVAENWPAPPEDRVYEVWLMPEDSDTPVPSVLFLPRGDGSAQAAIPDVEGVREVLVTTEPVGGSEEPSSRPILTASLT